MSADQGLLSQPELPPSFPIIWKDSIAYERARVGRVFNYRRPSRYPRAVVEATTESHIVEAVRLANQLGCRVSVRSGGHSWAAWSVRDDAILIDLGKFFHFHLDNETGILQASPSMTGRMVNRLLDPHGRMFPGGHCPDVALGGFLLQGGMGWNCKVRISEIPTDRQTRANNRV
jgi:FAD/FMN-containing dehydrogenase